MGQAAGGGLQVRQKRHGPPSKLTDAIIETIIAAAERGVPLTVSLRAAGFSVHYSQTLRHAVLTGLWDDGSPVYPETLVRLRSFAERYDAAIAVIESRAVQNIVETGFAITKQNIPEWRAHAWWLSHADTRSRYFEHRELALDVTRGEVPPEHRKARILSDDDLAEIADMRDLLPEPVTPDA